MKWVIYIFFTMICFSCSGQVSEKIPLIKAGGSAVVKIEGVNVTDSVVIQSSYWPVLSGPHESFTEEHIITSDTTVWQIYHISIPSKQNVNISKNIAVPVFLVPSDTLEIKVDYQHLPDNPVISFKGTYANICRYLYEMPAEINFSIAGAQLFNDPFRAKSPEESLTLYKIFSDSFAVKQKEYLQMNINKYKLPGWFVEYESMDRDLSVVVNQQNLPSYWKMMMQVDMEVPAGYLDSIREINLHNSVGPFSWLYFPYIGNLLKTELEGERTEIKLAEEEGVNMIDELKGTIVYSEYKEEFFRKAVDLAEVKLPEEHLNPFLLNYFFFYTNNENYDLKEKCFTYLKTKVKEEDYLAYLQEHHDRFSGLLKAGSGAPGFYLMSDLEDKYIHLSDFKGKVVLLNFWFPGCKPCIAEIPYEKELLKTFGENEFAIINVCLETTPENWKAAVKRFGPGGVNVVTQGNWERKLKEEYGVGGFPHYVLIDKEGFIIENKTFRPQNPLLSALIKKHLESE